MKTQNSPFYTVDKETTDDALLATYFLQNEPLIDKNQIYILGHSQGAMMLPNRMNINFYKSQFELLNDPNFSSQNPPKDFYFGSAVFWDSIRKIKAVEMSKEQKAPLLIIQGERDY